MKGLQKDGTWVDLKKNGQIVGRRFEKIMIDTADDFKWIHHLRCRLRKNIEFKTHAEKCKDLNDGDGSMALGAIIPVDNFEFYPLDARLKMIETLNQVVTSGDMNLDYVQEASKKLKKLIKLL